MWWHILKFFTSVKEKFQVDMKKKKVSATTESAPV